MLWYQNHFYDTIEIYKNTWKRRISESKWLDEELLPLYLGLMHIMDDNIVAGVQLASCVIKNGKIGANLIMTFWGQITLLWWDSKVKKLSPNTLKNMAMEFMGLNKSRCIILEEIFIDAVRC